MSNSGRSEYRNNKKVATKHFQTITSYLTKKVAKMLL